MNVRLVSPTAAPLLPWIECFYEVHGPARRPITIIPEGTWELVFALGFRGSLTSSGRTFDITGATVTGLHEQVLEVHPGGDLHAVGVKFKAPGLYPFLGIPMSDLSGRVEAAESLFGKADLIATHERLALARSMEARVAILQPYLLGLLNNQADRRLLSALREIESRNGSVAISQLAASRGLSQRRLGALFSDQVGVSPKQYARIVRFRSIVRGLCRHGRTPHLTALGLDHDFADQSHFIREFKSFTGASPRRWLKGQSTSEKYNF